jgi:hypothetical protein
MGIVSKFELSEKLKLMGFWCWQGHRPFSSGFGVRRDKAALSSGCKSHPATAPAGSNRSSCGGDEMAEAFGMRVTNW